MAKKDKIAKLVAVFALFGIIIGIVGTGITILFGGGQQSSNNEQSLTPEQYKQIQDMIKTQGGTGVLVNSGETNSGKNDSTIKTNGIENGFKVSTGSIK